MRGRAAICLSAFAALAGCTSEYQHPAPPRVTEAARLPMHNSTLAVPIELSLDDLAQGLESRTPRRLWSIDEQKSKCVPGKRVKILGERLKITPDIGCRIVGQVTRGTLKLSGSGRRISIIMPVRASVSARDVGGILKGETATGSAIVRADVQLSLDPHWSPRAKVSVSYDWREPPGIDFLGHRIRFARRADRELAKVIAGLERDLQREVARADVKPVVEGAWKAGFTVIELNRDKPPAWMRVTPKGLGVTGYRVDGRRVRLNVAAQALTETFVGQRPSDPEPAALPPQLPGASDKGMRFFIPVNADYAQIEPVALRALRRLAQ